MIEDVRYLEFKFLTAVAKGAVELFDQRDEKKILGVTLSKSSYVEMVATLVEELYIRFRNEELQLYVSRLRNEISVNRKPSFGDQYHWDNPRNAIERFLSGWQTGLHKIEITYRGLRRIQELRDLLQYDRILEPHGILLSIQYFRRDLEDALKNSPNPSVSVISADMDNFKGINTDFGHDAGDVVMKAYLGCVKDVLDGFGEGYRGVGDEVLALIVGQGHRGASDLAKAIKKRVAEVRCEYKGKVLHRVTASIGIATTPPESRTMDVEEVAKERGYKAKASGKNCVIAS